MFVYCICNQKGGVGKTCSTLNLAVGLAKQNKKVLAIDMDPQGSLSISLGISDPDLLDITISNKIQALLWDDNPEFDQKEGILTHKEGIDFLPANIELADMEISLVTALAREHLLGKYLDLLGDSYDYVVLDCSPSLGLVTINALCCANQVIIPVQAHFLSVKGMEQLLRTLLRVKQKLNRSLEIGGILITMANQRTLDFKETVNALYDAYGAQIHIFETVIPFSTRAVEAPKKGVSMFSHDPKGKVTLAYQRFVEELISPLEDTYDKLEQS